MNPKPQERATPRESVHLLEPCNLVLLPILGFIKWQHKTQSKNSYGVTHVPSGEGRPSKAAQLREAQAPVTGPTGWATEAGPDTAVGVGDAEEDRRCPAEPRSTVLRWDSQPRPRKGLELLKGPQRLEDRTQHHGQQGRAPRKPRAICQSQTPCPRKLEALVWSLPFSLLCWPQESIRTPSYPWGFPLECATREKGGRRPESPLMQLEPLRHLPPTGTYCKGSPSTGNWVSQPHLRDNLSIYQDSVAATCLHFRSVPTEV